MSGLRARESDELNQRRRDALPQRLAMLKMRASIWRRAAERGAVSWPRQQYSQSQRVFDAEFWRVSAARSGRSTSEVPWLTIIGASGHSVCSGAVSGSTTTIVGWPGALDYGRPARAATLLLACVA